MTTGDHTPYTRTLCGSSDLPDRLIESQAFLSMRCRLPGDMGVYGWLRVVLFQEGGCAFSVDETACEIEVVPDLGFEAQARDIPVGWRSRLVEIAGKMIVRRMGFFEGLVDYSADTPFETHHLHDRTLRFSVDMDLCIAMLAWEEGRLQALARSAEVEMLRLPGWCGSLRYGSAA